MANPFGDRDQASKRPAQTIEGTATEVGVEPSEGDASAAATESGRGEGEDRAERQGEGPANAAEPPRTRIAAAKSFMTHLVAGLIGGLIGVIAAALSSGGVSPDVASLEQRVAKLESAPRPAPDDNAIAAMESRVAGLEDNEKKNAAKLSQLSDRVASLDTSLDSLAKSAEEGGSVADAAALTGMEKAIAELKAKLNALAEAQLGTADATVSQPELATLTERLKKLEAVLPELAGTIDKEATGAKSAALAIAFANLRAAVSDGRPYAAELDTITALAPALGDLGVLPAYAEKGIPTVAELARAFAEVSDQARAASAAPADGSVVGSVIASAQSLVTIRRIDEAPAGEGAEATLSRAQKALDHDDLAVAVKEVETLQGKQREAFASWLGEAHARLSAGEALTRLEGALLISLSGDAETSEP
jgi:hypothetical protein